MIKKYFQTDSIIARVKILYRAIIDVFVDNLNGFLV